MIRIYKFLAVAAIFITVAASEGRPQEDSAAGRLADCEGTVTVIGADGSTKNGADEMKIYRGQVVSTDAGAGADLLFADGSRLTIGELTKIRVDDFVFSEQSKKRKSTLSLLFGRIRAAVRKLGDEYNSEFGVSTPSAVAGVRGTEFIVVADEDDQTQVFTLQGAVEVARQQTPDEKVLVRAGEWVSVVRERARLAKQRLSRERLLKLQNMRKARQLKPSEFGRKLRNLIRNHQSFENAPPQAKKKLIEKLKDRRR